MYVVGLPIHDVHFSYLCTFCSDEYFSGGDYASPEEQYTQPYSNGNDRFRYTTTIVVATCRIYTSVHNLIFKR